MSSNKASKLKFFWIAFLTGIYTFWYSSKVVIYSFFSRNFRAKVDQCMMDWSKKLLKLIGVTTRVTGNTKVFSESERPIIIMCNHSSLYDIPMSIAALNTSLRMLAKKELFKIPIFASALRRGEFVSIDRHNREQSRKDLQIAKQKMLEGIVLWAAPEGTRSKDGKLAEFKRGGFHLALDTSAMIVPIVIKDIHKVQAGNDLTLYLNQEVEVEICEPVDAANYTTETRRELINQVRNKMLLALGQR